jgi:aminoglycoside 3-N-acetyltransferase
MGVIAETVRRWAGAVRSTHPQTSFAAVGAAAVNLMAEHDRECHLGPGTPLARLASGSAKVLLLGVSYGVCTAFHLGEYEQPNPPQRDYECVVLDHGVREWFRYRDVLLSDHDFEGLGHALELSERDGAVRRGRLGSAELRLIPLRTCVDFARTWLRDNRPGDSAFAG